MSIWTKWLNSDNKAVGDAIRPDSNGVTIKTVVSPNIINTEARDIVIAPEIASYFSFITQILVTNADSNNGTWVNIKDEDGNVFCTGFAAANGGGFSVSYGNTPPRTLLPNKKIQAQCETAAQVRVSICVYENV